MPHFTTLNGSRIFYKRVGQGPPLLLIMGTGLDHSVWNQQVNSYYNNFECIVFDNPGLGESWRTPKSDPLTTASIAKDVVELLEHLELKPVHVSGLSLGSCVAQELVLARPDLVKTLQLHGTWARADGYVRRKFQAQINLLRWLDLRAFYEINVLWLITPEYFRRYPDVVESQINTIVSRADKRELIQQYEADIDHDTLSRLRRVTVPTLVTVGSYDVATPPLYSREVAEAIDGAEFGVFEEGGHLHNVENPEQFNRVTLDFLLRHR